MVQEIRLAADEIVAGHPFSDPAHSHQDLERMRQMAQQLVDRYDDPQRRDFVPGKRVIDQADPQGRDFRIYYIRPKLLFSRKHITAVGFFGKKRDGADIEPLVKADKRFEQTFMAHEGLLSLSTVRLRSGDFCNLVLFTDPESKDNWNYSQLHYDLVSEISPPYYHSVRLNNGLLPAGLARPDQLFLTRVRYLDYDSDPHWRAVRYFQPPE